MTETAVPSQSEKLGQKEFLLIKKEVNRTKTPKRSPQASKGNDEL